MGSDGDVALRSASFGSACRHALGLGWRWRRHLSILCFLLPSTSPAKLVFLSFLLALLPLAIDGSTHALNDALFGPYSMEGFRNTNAWLAAFTLNRFPEFYAGDHLGTFNWWARLLTGLLAAWAVAFTLFPMLDYFRMCGQVAHETQCKVTR